MAQFQSRNALYHNTELYGHHDFLHREIAGRLLDYIEGYAINPSDITNFGLHSQFLTDCLRARYPQATLHRADEHSTVFTASELVVSNLYLQDAQDLGRLIEAYGKSLAPQGALIFTTIATESFPEFITQEGLALNPYPDIKELGNFLHALGFVDTVMHIEKVSLTYERLETLLQDLRVVGAPLFHPTFKGLRTRRWYERWAAHMAQYYHEGCYTLSLDLLYGQAKAPQLSSQRMTDGAAFFDVRDIKKL